jgi:hypothetical protein
MATDERFTMAPPTPPSIHPSRRGLRAEEAALEVHIEDVVPVRLGHGQEVHAGEDARVVDEDRWRAQLARHRAHHRLRVARPGDVTPGEARAAPRTPDLGHDPLGGVAVVQVVDADVGALAGKRHRDGAADALLGARHERDLAGETHELLRPASGSTRGPVAYSTARLFAGEAVADLPSNPRNLRCPGGPGPAILPAPKREKRGWELKARTNRRGGKPPENQAAKSQVDEPKCSGRA